MPLKCYWLAYFVFFAATFASLPPAIEPERVIEHKLAPFHIV